MKKLSLFISRLEKLLVIILIVVTPLLFSGKYLAVYEYPKFLVSAVIAVLLMLVVLTNPSKSIKRNYLLLLVFLAIAVVFNVANSINPYRSVFGDTTFSDSILAFTVLLGIFTYFVYTNLLTKQILNYIVISGFIISVLSIFHFAALNIFHWTDIAYDGRVTATIGQPNILGGILATTIPLIVYLYKENKAKKWFYVVSFFTVILAILSTGSRGAMTALAIFFIYEVYSYLKSKRAKIAFITTIAVMLGVVILIPPLDIANSEMPYAFKRLLSFKDQSRVYDMRFEIWDNSIRLIKEKPLTGWGNGTFQEIYPRYLSHENAPGTVFLEVESSHNVIVDVSAEWGIVVLILSILFFTYLFRGQKSHYIQFALLMLIIRGLFDLTSVNIFVLTSIYIALLFKEKKTVSLSAKLYRPLLVCISILVFIAFLFVYRIGIAEKYERMALTEGDSNTVVSYYKKAIVANPFKQSLWDKYIALLYWRNDEDLLKMAEHSYKAFSDYRSAMYLGLYYLRSGSNDKAIEYLSTASKLNNRDPKVFHYLGLLYYGAENYDASYDNFSKTLELDKKNFSDDYVYLAQISVIRGDYKLAKEQIKKAPASQNRELIMSKLYPIESNTD